MDFEVILTNSFIFYSRKIEVLNKRITELLHSAQNQKESCYN